MSKYEVSDNIKVPHRTLHWLGKVQCVFILLSDPSPTWGSVGKPFTFIFLSQFERLWSYEFRPHDILVTCQECFVTTRCWLSLSFPFGFLCHCHWTLSICALNICSSAYMWRWEVGSRPHFHWQFCRVPGIVSTDCCCDFFTVQTWASVRNSWV